MQEPECPRKAALPLINKVKIFANYSAIFTLHTACLQSAPTSPPGLLSDFHIDFTQPPLLRWFSVILSHSRVIRAHSRLPISLAFAWRRTSRGSFFSGHVRCSSSCSAAAGRPRVAGVCADAYRRAAIKLRSRPGRLAAHNGAPRKSCDRWG